MADIYDGIRIMDDDTLRRIIATMEEVTVSGGMDEFMQKAHKGTVKFLNGFIKAFDSKLIDEPVITSREDRISSKLEQLKKQSRGELEIRLKMVLADKAVAAGLMSASDRLSDDSLYAAVVEGAMRFVNSQKPALGTDEDNKTDNYSMNHASVASKAEYIYARQMAMREASKKSEKPKMATLSSAGQSSGHHDYYVGEKIIGDSSVRNASNVKGSSKSSDSESDIFLTGNSESILTSGAGILSLAMNKDNIIYGHFAGFVAECGKVLSGSFVPAKSSMPSFLPDDQGFFVSRNHEKVREQLKRYRTVKREYTDITKEIEIIDAELEKDNTRIAEIEEESKELKSKIISLRREVRLRDKGIAPAKENLASRLEQLNDEANMNEDTIRAYQEAKKNYEQVSAGVNSRNKNIEALIARISELTKEQDNIEKMIAVTKDRRDELIKKRDMLSEQLASEEENNNKIVKNELSSFSLKWRGAYTKLSFSDDLLEHVMMSFSYDEFVPIEIALAELNRASNPLGLCKKGAYEFVISESHYGIIYLSKCAYDRIAEVTGITKSEC